MKKFMLELKKTHYNRDSKVRLGWFGHEQRMEENRIPKKVLYMNFGITTLRIRPRNRWQDGVREGGRKKYITERNGKRS